jgi:hypothetical protein
MRSGLDDLSSLLELETDLELADDTRLPAFKGNVAESQLVLSAL